jgi:ATP-dependent DNA helicase RecG
MIVHRDYTASADSVVKIFPNHIVFYNPGPLPSSISIEQLRTNNYVSSPRNKQIAKIVKELGWIEKYGTGIKRICRLFIEHNLAEPEFISVQDGLMVKVYDGTLPNAYVNIQDKVTDKVTDTQRKIIELVKQNKFISASQMAAQIGISKRKIIDNINKLKLLQLITRIGEIKGGHWKVRE